MNAPTPADAATRWLRYAQDDLTLAVGAAKQARAVWETVLDDLDRHGLDVSAYR